jgi:tetratricopeptide (TPR) repeat protein
MLIAIALSLSFAAQAPEPSEAQRDFEAGRYRQVVESVQPESASTTLFFAVFSAQKLEAPDRAADLARRLASRPDDDPWHFVGLSISQLLGGNDDGALEAARRAVALDGRLAEAQYQLGLALAKRQAWREAAAAFDRAAELNPRLAHAYYYGGLMHYRANRPDLMAVRFEQFLKLAPEASERPEVMQIMRTIRGK